MSIYKLAEELDKKVPQSPENKPNKEKKDKGYVPNMPIKNLVPNRYQPRSKWEPGKLMELADSIRENGIIEPLIVTHVDGKKDRYEIIAGERRYRASKLAGLRTVPVVIMEATPQQMLELAVVENVQRSDLNPLEEALAFSQLADEFGLTHEQIAVKVGCSRPVVANKIRLLQLPDDIKFGLLEGKISEGHARAILGLNSRSSMVAVYTKVVREKLSVRETEALVRKLNLGSKKDDDKSRKKFRVKVDEYEKSLQKAFNRRVNIKTRGDKLIMQMKFESEKDLNTFINLVNKKDGTNK